MSDKGSVFQKGGGGTNFEQLVQTAFLTTLIIRGYVPSVTSGTLAEVAFQVTNKGYQTDDLFAVAKSIKAEHRLLIQIKHNISFTAENQTFKEVVSAFWVDFNNSSIFNKETDKLLIIKSALTKDERNHLKSLFNWAVNHATELDFISEVDRIKGKKNRLDVFRKVLKEINNNVALNDKEIWEFLKCLDVLEYDFLNETSVDKSYFLNLIKLSKSENSTATENEIWDSIFSYVAMLNKDGGSATIESIKNKDFFKHFDNEKLSPYFKSVEKLKSDSKEILRPIKTTIGDGKNELHLPRTKAREEILRAITDSQITVVTGKPGVGKSAEIKGLLSRNFPNANTLIFRADQYSAPTLANVFSSQGVNETIQDIFSCISLIPEKIIFIDSLEKLLEADPECAFRQLLALIKEHSEIKIIASSRKYAIDLITLKFGIDKSDTNIIDIPTFDEAEFKIISDKFPQLSSILKNKKLKKLLQSPKYLDFSIKAISKTNEDYANVSLVEFKDELWNSLVVDSTNTKNGLPIKREEAFIEIAVKRAKEMKLFTKPNKSDAEAITCLENDEIVFQENNNRKYSPTHDILEDWALVKYVSSKYEDFPNPIDLFSKLGNEPAIRRAFRLWVEDYLIDNNSKINNLISETISNTTIEKYWADELLVAIFKSENCNSFFMTFEKELLANSATLFNRCLHIIKTCCKESEQLLNNNLLLPIGSGWFAALLFIEKHILQLENIKLSILNFLTDWYYRLLFQYNFIEISELEIVKKIVLIYIEEIEDEKVFWQEENTKSKSSILIDILFDLAIISKKEIQDLINRSFVNKEKLESWKLNSFYENIIKKCLSGIGNEQLIKELPELIVETASKSWKYTPPKKEDLADDRFSFFERDSLRGEKCWGISDRRSFFPSGIYKTPIYNLLKLQPIIGLKFTIDFINYSVDFYINASCEYKHKISQIEIELNDGGIVKQWAAWELWAAYRGLSVTNYAIESLLMSLEKFLLEIAKQKTEVGKENLKFIFNYVLRNSNNIAPLAVITSVMMAYPSEIEETVIPLLSIGEFYSWDISRAIQEMSTLSPMDNDISMAQNERWKSNQLPHRKKYTRGLVDFIVDYQFNIRKLNLKIHELFDKVKGKIKEDDLLWKKRLNEIDIRNWEASPYDEKLGSFVVQPKYEKVVAEHIASNKDYIESQNIAATYSGIISKAHKKEISMNFEKWTECQKYYSNPENLDFLYSRPITLAILGLNEFSNSTSDDQKKWCLETLFQSIVAILQDTYIRGYESSNNYNLMEKEIALSSFHLIMQNIKGDEEKNGIIATLIYMLSAPFDNHEINKITRYIRENFFTAYPNEAKRVWLNIIKYSNYKKVNPELHTYQDEKNAVEAQKKEENYIFQIAADSNLKINFSEISLKNNEAYLLERAFVIIPFDKITNNDFSNYINHILPIILDDLIKEEDYSYLSKKESRQFHYESISNIEQHLSDLFLNGDIDFSKSILTTLINSISSSNQNQRLSQNDSLKFINTTLKYVVLKLYDNGNSKIANTIYLQQQERFWSLWETLFDLIPENSNHSLTEILLLDIKYLLYDFKGNPSENDWSVLDGKKEFYKRIFLTKGKKNISSVINVFSTIGGKEFLPDGMSWLVDLFKLNILTSISLTTTSSERLIKRLFYDHISKIKNDRKLIDDYIWILNRMVELGSSQAYLFRENVITYKISKN